MYKELKKQIEDKKILEENIRGLEERIKYKIHKELGLRSTSYSELKIECPTVDDKFARTFAKVESLDKDLQRQKAELKIIEDTLQKVDILIGKMNDRDKKIFRCRYIWGLSVAQTAERLNYTKDYVKECSRKMFQK